MYKSNLAYAEYPAETFDATAANAATIEPTGVFAAAKLRRPVTVASFTDIYAADQRPFRIF